MLQLSPFLVFDLSHSKKFTIVILRKRIRMRNDNYHFAQKDLTNHIAFKKHSFYCFHYLNVNYTHKKNRAISDSVFIFNCKDTHNASLRSKLFHLFEFNVFNVVSLRLLLLWSSLLSCITLSVHCFCSCFPSCINIV